MKEFEGSPVQGNGQEVKDGGGAAEDIAACPHVAQKRAKHPPLPDLE